VDDYVNCADTMAELLSIWGFEVAIARDGNSALEIARSFDTDANRLDICRAGIDGYEVTHSACWACSASGNRSTTRGYGQERDCEPSCLAGFDYIWSKPVSSAELQGILSAN
jgi:CheY-like chemotaxis protein